MGGSALKTLIQKSPDTIRVTLNGFLDFGTAIPLREGLSDLVRQMRANKESPQIIFDLQHLEFVGSSGIASFIQALKEFKASSPRPPKFCHVKSEFQRMIRAFDEDLDFDFSEDDSPTVNA